MEFNKQDLQNLNVVIEASFAGSVHSSSDAKALLVLQGKIAEQLEALATSEDNVDG